MKRKVEYFNKIR